MKLDLNGIGPSIPLPKSQIVTAGTVQEPNSGTTASPSLPEDRTTFRSGPGNMAALVSSALASPEIRQDKVDTIRQSIGNGTYKFDAAKVADAMISSSEQS